jgi:PIN domain nuclease of toxin-antitoxin system/ribosomal protein S18 acetylase RimI-like enzyme
MPGRRYVDSLIEQACMSTDNLAETYTCIVRDDRPLAGILTRLDALPIEWVAFSDVHASKVGELWRSTRRAGLSLRDRACLAIAIERRLPLLATNRVWAGLGLPVEVTADPMSDGPDAEELALASLTLGDLPLLERFVRAYYVEDGHEFHEERQPAALAALAAGDVALGRGWLVRHRGQTVGYVVLTRGFSIEAGGCEGCIDELYLVPEVRGRGLGRRVLALLEAEAGRLGARRLFLEVERGNRAIALYRRAGFVDHGRHLLSKQLDAGA